MKKPDWLRVPYQEQAVAEVAQMMQGLSLNTVCREANCPNLGECYAHRTATFLILGSHCTRNCRFCNVTCARPEPVDPEEPARLAQAAQQLSLRHVVVTCSTRDDLPDGGAAQFAAVTRALRMQCPDATIELLISDFKGDTAALDVVLDAQPDVLGHNMEMPRALYPDVCPQADYDRSLFVLDYCKRRSPQLRTKTGFMLGLGETEAQVETLLDDIRAVRCDLLTIGQYLQPSAAHWPLDRYVTPEEFAHWKQRALEKGFRHVASGPLVRSSYRALEALEAAQ